MRSVWEDKSEVSWVTVSPHSSRIINAHDLLRKVILPRHPIVLPRGKDFGCQMFNKNCDRDHSGSDGDGRVGGS